MENPDDPEGGLVSQRTLRFLQATAFLVVLFGSIWIGQEAEYDLNPIFPGMWAFMAAYGLGLFNDWYARRSAARRDRLASRSLRLDRRPD